MYTIPPQTGGREAHRPARTGPTSKASLHVGISPSRPSPSHSETRRDSGASPGGVLSPECVIDWLPRHIPPRKDTCSREPAVRYVATIRHRPSPACPTCQSTEQPIQELLRKRHPLTRRLAVFCHNRASCAMASSQARGLSIRQHQAHSPAALVPCNHLRVPQRTKAPQPSVRIRLLLRPYR